MVAQINIAGTLIRVTDNRDSLYGNDRSEEPDVAHRLLLWFTDGVVEVLALPETDEIEAGAVPAPDSRGQQDVSQTAPWLELLGQRCTEVWRSVNQQGYHDLLCLGFDKDVAMPSVALCVVASQIKASRVRPA
jgi:hypothetical protein